MWGEPTTEQKQASLLLSNFFIVEKKPTYNVSIKLVIPGGCNYNCPFCFNKLTTATATHNRENFLRNFPVSLKKVLDYIGPDRSVSLDVTGNEPTYDPDYFLAVLEKLEEFKPRFNKFVLTTNGKRLDNVRYEVARTFDIINMSVHHYDTTERAKAFGCYRDELSYSNYSQINNFLTTYNYDKFPMTITAVAVLYKELTETFVSFINHFSAYAKSNGFTNVRLRSNFYKDDKFFTRYLNDNTFGGTVTEVAGLKSKTIRVRDIDVTLLQGVEALTDHVIGVEAVVDDDGLAYLDYNKKYPIVPQYFNHVYVHNKYNRHNLSTTGPK